MCDQLCNDTPVYSSGDDDEAGDEELAIDTLQYSDGSDDEATAAVGAAGDDEDGLMRTLSSLELQPPLPPPPLPPQKLVSDIDPTYRLERVRCSELSVADFRRRVAASRLPLIIEGVPVPEAGVPGLRAGVVRAALPADLEVPVRGRGTMPAASFFDALDRGEPFYMADLPVTRHFPWLHRLYRAPRYFMHCFSHRTRRALSIAHDTPALFIGGAGTRSALHVDQMCSNFWMCRRRALFSLMTATRSLMTATRSVRVWTRDFGVAGACSDAGTSARATSTGSPSTRTTPTASLLNGTSQNRCATTACARRVAHHMLHATAASTTA